MSHDHPTHKNKTKAEVRQLPSGFWAVFIGGVFVDAASPSEEAAKVKLNQLLKTMKGEKNNAD